MKRYLCGCGAWSYDREGIVKHKLRTGHPSPIKERDDEGGHPEKEEKA